MSAGAVMRGCGHGSQAFRAPIPLVVALAVETGEHADGARDLARQAEPGQELEPVHGERNVADVALSVGAQGVAQQLEHRLEQLLASQDEKSATPRRRREILAPPRDEPR